MEAKKESMETGRGRSPAIITVIFTVIFPVVGQCLLEPIHGLKCLDFTVGKPGPNDGDIAVIFMAK